MSATARTAVQQALVWQRSDFRETSQLVTLITREQGKVITLAKGSHRHNSPFLGCIDFLNLVEARLSRGSLPLLYPVKLLHEHRGLRQPRRYLAASYLVELFDPAFPHGRVDQELFDLLAGGLRLLERCPSQVIPQVLMGVELRLLGELGVKPPLGACARCGRRAQLYPALHEPALLCPQHRDGSCRPVPRAALIWLQRAADCAGRDLPGLPPAPPAARALLGRFVAQALERAPRLRQRALTTAGSMACAAGA